MIDDTKPQRGLLIEIGVQSDSQEAKVKMEQSYRLKSVVFID